MIRCRCNGAQFMAANASFSPARPVPVSRRCLFVFESNLRVLNYLKRTFSALYDLRLFSEERAFLRDLEAMHWPSLVLLAWDGISQSMPLFRSEERRVGKEC